MTLAQEHRRLRSLLSQLSAVEAAAETGVAALEPVFTAVPRFNLDDFDAARRYLQTEGYVILAS